MSEKRKLLLVDDSTYTLELLQALLGDQFEYMCAYSGPDAMQMIRSGCSCPDGLLLDIFMPQMDGYELLAELRSFNRFKRLPVLVISGHYSGLDAEKALSLKICGFVAKPFTRTELNEAVEYMCRLMPIRYKTNPVADAV